MLFMSSIMQKFQRKSRYALCDQAVGIKNTTSGWIVFKVIDFYLATVDYRVFASGSQDQGCKYAPQEITKLVHIHTHDD